MLVSSLFLYYPVCVLKHPRQKMQQTHIFYEDKILREIQVLQEKTMHAITIMPLAFCFAI